jgi:hypothetical protein
LGVPLLCGGSIQMVLRSSIASSSAMNPADNSEIDLGCLLEMPGSS